MGEAAYLTIDARKRLHQGLSQLVRSLAENSVKRFGSFLIVEIWTTDPVLSTDAVTPEPGFSIVSSRGGGPPVIVDTLEKRLKQIRVHGRAADVDLMTVTSPRPPGLPALVPVRETAGSGCHLIGLGVKPVYLGDSSGEVFPLVRRALHRGLSTALKMTFFEFTRKHTRFEPAHYFALGRRRVVKAVWTVDRQLAELRGSFDFLLQVTPVNAEAAWAAFRKGRYRSAPTFLYRPLPFDPTLVKRQLYNIPLERIEDPTLAQLFREQQFEIDRRLTMLIDRGTAAFLPGSVPAFGVVDKPLMSLAEELLTRLPKRGRHDTGQGYLDARAFAERAENELNYYRSLHTGIEARIHVREDTVGLMVVRGNLLIGRSLKVPVSRVEALLQHEVGTHVLTHVNGRAQPFRQLALGLPGYEDLQEGLAVLAEYLVGGLDRSRVRQLAARVVAVRRLLDGASFVEVFKELTETHGFAKRAAFNITTRVFRGGGLTKDAAYLRGLARLLTYLGAGGELEPLFVGKIAEAHISMVQELRWRHVLSPPPLRPRYLTEPAATPRLQQLSRGLTVLELVERKKR
jgi:uncharacterized protein (TIGR02421 family)